jgi:hypothetical protein
MRLGKLLVHQTRLASPQYNWLPGRRAVCSHPLTPWPPSATAEATIGGCPGPRLLTSGAGRDDSSFLRLPQPSYPPPFHHGRLCVVWGEAGPPCAPIALLPHPHPLGLDPKKPQSPTLRALAGKASYPPTSEAGLLSPLSPPETET